MMGVEPFTEYRPVGLGRALEAGIVIPALATQQILHQIKGMFQRTVPAQLVGPVGIVNETVRQAQQGWRQAIEWSALISLQLFIFNLLPIPALDGGRLVLLGIEMATKKRVNPNIEQKVLAYSLMLMLGLFLVVTAKEIWERIVGLFHG
jgi:regulator of sigma E protease